jgi:hypothetical protein
VRAYNSAGNSAYSNVASTLTTAAKANTVSLFSNTPVESGNDLLPLLA